MAYKQVRCDGLTNKSVRTLRRAFVDLEKVNDRIDREAMFRVLRLYGVDKHFFEAESRVSMFAAEHLS